MKSIEQAFDDLELIKVSVCRFADNSERCSVLDSNGSQPALHEGRYELIAGVGCKKLYTGNLTTQLSASEASSAWKFASVTYGNPHAENTKAEIFEPELVFIIKRGSKILSIVNNGISNERFEYLLRAFRNPVNEKPGQAVTESGFEPETDKNQYIETVEKIREDIRNGAYYEMNYCIGFTAKLRTSNLLPYYFRLCSLSAAPFSAYLKNSSVTLLCSSPERFIMRAGNKIVSQPIKGTNAALTGAENHQQLEALKSNEKERAENVMIVDLVRNDLARICLSGTVKVDELCGAYTYRSVNHLVSSVSGELKPEVGLTDIFQAMFPMGSMTGAPKLEVMKHIELYETGSRGIYSGCIGYISPDGDFDFNVVIRTLVYEPDSGKVSYRVGSAITYDSIPEKEYEECMLKGSRLASVFRDSVL